MNQPTMDRDDWQALGSRLAAARREQGLELQEVSTRLRLTTRTLRAIERGQVAELSPVYLKGHLQRYIALLSAETPALGDIDLRPMFAEADVTASVPLPSALPAPPASTLFDNALRVASYVVVTAGVVIPLVWWFTQGAVRMSFDERVVEQPATVTPDPAVASSDADRQGADTPRPSIRPGHLQAAAAPFASMRGDVDEVPSLIGDELLRTDREDDVPVPPLRRMADVPGAGEELVLTMLNDSWVEITDASGERVEFDLLRGGERYAYRVERPLSILIGKASAVDLSLAGRAVDLSPYTRGNVARLQLPAADAD
jgi:cytoskeleton protein RodZ